MDKFLTRSSSIPNLVNKRPREDGTSSDQWQQPKRFFTNSKETSKDREIPTNNRYRGLPVDDQTSEFYLKATKKKEVNNTPPIIIELLGDCTHQKIKDLILKHIKDFHMQYKGRNIVRVQCYSAKNHQLVKDCLLKENVAFHTFTRKDEKSPKAVIKGLPKSVHDTLPTELASIGFPECIVSKIKTLRPTEYPPVLVQLPRGTDMTKFKQIKYVMNCVVEIQRYKPNKKLGTQCFRCQGFGHASRNCNRPVRCVKCTLAHPTWECPKKENDGPARCCNCQDNHPANYAQCQARLQYIERIQSKRETLRKAVIPEITNPKINLPGMSWAKVASSGKKDQTRPRPVTPVDVAKKTLLRNTAFSQHDTNTSDPVAKTSQDFEASEMLEILTVIKSIKKEFAKCKTFMDKVILILTHLGHYV
ncbi:unnamed protein product, partial [Brenthis ino]